MALNLQHQTPAQFAGKFWARVADVQGADKIAFCRLMHWLENRLVAGDLTDTQARNSYNAAFGKTLTAGQWTTLRTNRIQPAHARYAAMLAEGGI